MLPRNTVLNMCLIPMIVARAPICISGWGPGDATSFGGSISQMLNLEFQLVLVKNKK